MKMIQIVGVSIRAIAALAIGPTGHPTLVALTVLFGTAGLLAVAALSMLSLFFACEYHQSVFRANALFGCWGCGVYSGFEGIRVSLGYGLFR